ncbi:MAG: hypothetical protein RLZZ214_1453 [Verrucomicrobiota bacterium]
MGMDTIPGSNPMENPPLAPLGGLDPANLLQQGAAEDTFIDGAGHSFNPPPIPELAAIFPQFEILELIGKGGMGAVYKVRQKDLDRIVALKILPPAIGQSPEFSNRFTREAKALARLNHPGIVTLHEFGQADGLYFILMEFVDGVNLAQLMKTGRISPREALAIVPQICDALQYAHDQGIVHRDIKPENILLDRLGRVKVADFGIAKVVAAVCEDPIRSGEIPVPTDQTLAGKIIGTPQYMAPEQIDHPADVDHRADIYALGVVFYQMLTGELPGKRLEAPSKKVHIDVRLDQIVLRAMEKEPDLRYQTAREFRTVVDGVQAPAKPPSLPLLAPKRGMLRRWWWVFLIMFPLGLLIGLAAGAVFAYVTPKRYEAETVIEVVPAEGSLISPDFFGSQFKAIKSREALTAVAEQLELPNQWMLSQDSVVRTLQDIVIAQNIRGTDLINIRVRHTSKQDAVEIANAVMLNYQRSFPGKVVIHEKALEPTTPVSPNVELVLFAGSLLGIILSPIPAFILIGILHRMFPEKGPAVPAVKTRRKGRIVAIVCGVLGAILSLPLMAVGILFLLKPVKKRDVAAGRAVAEALSVTPVSQEVANEYLDLILGMATAKSSGLGSSHPSQIVAQRALDRFRARHPSVPDATCLKLASARQLVLAEKKAVFEDNGLGEVHPAIIEVQLQLDALAGVELGFSGRESERELPMAEKNEIGSPEVGVLAEMWLAGIDAGKYSRSWRAAANFFQSANTESRWISEVGQMRKPLGAVKSREIRHMKKVNTLTGAPDGEYFIIQFNTSFAARENAVEVVRFKLEEEGTWKAAGYLIR